MLLVTAALRSFFIFFICVHKWIDCTVTYNRQCAIGIYEKQKEEWDTFSSTTQNNLRQDKIIGWDNFCNFHLVIKGFFCFSFHFEFIFICFGVLTWCLCLHSICTFIINFLHFSCGFVNSVIVLHLTEHWYSLLKRSVFNIFMSNNAKTRLVKRIIKHGLLKILMTSTK